MKEFYIAPLAGMFAYNLKNFLNFFLFIRSRSTKASAMINKINQPKPQQSSSNPSHRQSFLTAGLVTLFLLPLIWIVFYLVNLQMGNYKYLVGWLLVLAVFLASVLIHALLKWKNVSKQLAKSQALVASIKGDLSTAMGSIREGYITTNTTGGITSLNQAALDMFGFTRDAGIGKSLFNLLELPPPAEIQKQLAANPTGTIRLPSNLHRANGSALPVEAAITSIPGGPGPNVAGLAVAINDLSELRAAAENSRQRELMLTVLLETAPFGIFIRDGQRRQVYENETLRIFYGSHQGETLEDFKGDPALLKKWARINEIAYHGQSVDYQDEQGTLLGTRTVRQIVAPVLDGQRVVAIVGCLLDVTEEKATRQALHTSQLALERAKAELEQFSIRIHRDLSEPLEKVAGTLRQMAEGTFGGLDDLGKRSMRLALADVDIMEHQLTDLLVLARVSTDGVTPTLCESQQALDQALKYLGLAEEGTSVIITHVDLPRVKADPAQLTLLFQQLVGNAMKYTPGKIPRVRVDCQTEPEQWHFSVKDNGAGIERRFAERVFDPYQRPQMASGQPSAGIGLAICKKIVERHGGTIWMESEVGAGSTFHFTLPK